jgi:hypothetical protein
VFWVEFHYAKSETTGWDEGRRDGGVRVLVCDFRASMERRRKR